MLIGATLNIYTTHTEVLKRIRSPNIFTNSPIPAQHTHTHGHLHAPKMYTNISITPAATWVSVGKSIPLQLNNLHVFISPDTPNTEEVYNFPSVAYQFIWTISSASAPLAVFRERIKCCVRIITNLNLPRFAETHGIHDGNNSRFNYFSSLLIFRFLHV